MAFLSPVASTVLSPTALFEGDVDVAKEVGRRYAEYELKDFDSWYGVPAGVIAGSIRDIGPVRELDPANCKPEKERKPFGTKLKHIIHARLSAASFVSQRPMYSIVEEALDEKLSEIEKEYKASSFDKE